MTSSKRRGIWILAVAGILVLALTAGGAWYYFKKRERAITVQTERVKRRDLTELVVATGRIQPVTKVVINPEVSGEIVDLPVRDGQPVRKGDLLVRIKPDPYVASRNSSEAMHRSALASVELARAELEKARLEFLRFEKLFNDKLISESEFLSARTGLEVSQARFESAGHQSDQAKASLARADEDLNKTTIHAPIDGTVTSLKSERGERVVGTAMMAGTEIMTVADLDVMEARVDVGEIDVVLVRVGQKVRLEVDSFRDRKFTGVVSEIANAAKTQGMNTQGEATRFEVRIRIQEKDSFRPGMSVTSEIETRYRTNVLTVPLQSVTTRLPREAQEAAKKNTAAARGQSSAEGGFEGDGGPGSGKRRARGPVVKPVEVVFLVNDGKAVSTPVSRGISDDEYVEITTGLEEGAEVVSGGYRAIARELEDGKKVKVDAPKAAAGAEMPANAESKP